MQFFFTEIQVLTLGCCIFFQHVSRTDNGMADSSAKQGIDRICNCLGLRCLVFISYTSTQLSFGYEHC